MKPDPHTPRWFWFVPPVLAVLLYAVTLRNGFVLDDRALILDDPRMGSLGSFFSLHSGELVLRYWSLLLDSVIWGTRPAGYHLTNLLLHAGCALALFGYLRAMLRATTSGGRRADGAALAAATLFAAHPMLTEAVDGVTHRKELLAAGFLLLALWRSLGAERGMRRAVEVGLAVAAALFAKAPAVVFFPLVALQDLWVRRRTGSTWLRRDLLFYLPATAALAGYLAYRWAGIAGAVAAPVYFRAYNPQAADLAAPARLLTSLRVLGLYWRLLILPWRPTLGRFVTPVRDVADPLPWLVLALAVAASFLAWKLRRSRPLLALGLAWLVLAPLPTLNILPLNFLFSERYLYLPAVGLALVGADLLYAAGRTPRGRRWTTIPVVLLLALFVPGVTLRNLEWKDPSTLLAAAVRHNPNSPRVAYFHAEDLRRRGHIEESLAECLRALAVQPRFPDAWHLAGRNYADLGRTGAAARAYGKAVRQARDPDPDWLSDYGVALLQLGRRKEGLSALERAVKRDPSHRRATENYAQALLLARETRPDGEALVERLTREHPGWSTPWILRVETRLAAGDTAAALKSATRARAVLADEAARSFLAARVLEIQGNPERAAAAYRALASAPGTAPSLRDRAAAALRRLRAQAGIQAAPPPR